MKKLVLVLCLATAGNLLSSGVVRAQSSTNGDSSESNNPLATEPPLPTPDPEPLAAPASTPNATNLGNTNNRDETLPWNKDGQSYANFASLRDDLCAEIAKTQSTIIVASKFLSDGDIATSLFSAKLRGVIVKVLVDAILAKDFLSRHNYLASNGIETFKRPFNKAEKKMGGKTTIVLDNSVWRISSTLDFRQKGAVHIDRSPFTAAEVLGWLKNVSAIPKPPAIEREPRTSSPTTSANSSTTQSLSLSVSDTIRNSRRTVKRVPTSRGLPRATRLQQLQAGTAEPEQLELKNSSAQVSGTIPEVPARESDLFQ